MHRQLVTSGLLDWLSPNPAAITIVFNRSYVSRHQARASLRTLGQRIDKRRLGGKFYRRPPNERLLFHVAPELFTAGHPHYHGLIRLPQDDLNEFGFDGVTALYREEFARIQDGGSLLIAPLTDAQRWISYCSKDGDLVSGEHIVSSHEFIPIRW